MGEKEKKKKVSDAYSTYLDLGSPNRLAKDAANEIKKKNGGNPIISSIVKIESGKGFETELPMRENDVYLLVLNKIKIRL